MINKEIEIVCKIKFIGNETLATEFTSLLLKEIKISVNNILDKINVTGEIKRLKVVAMR